MRKAIAFLMALTLTAAAAVAVDAEDIPNRTSQIQPGEWIILQDTSGETTDTNRITVLDRQGDMIKLRREHFDGEGKLVETTESELDLNRYRRRMENARDKAMEVTEEFITIGDKEHEVYGLLWEDADKRTGEKHQFKVLVSPELPISGVARFWTSNPEAFVADVIDYGFGNN